MIWRDAVRDSDLPSTTKLVAFVLWTYIGSGETYPARSTLASGASLTDRAVDAALERLEATGYLTIDPPRRPIRVAGKIVMRRPGGKRATNFYTFTVPETANDIRTRSKAKSEPRALKSERHALNSDASSAKSFVIRVWRSQGVA